MKRKVLYALIIIGGLASSFMMVFTRSETEAKKHFSGSGQVIERRTAKSVTLKLDNNEEDTISTNLLVPTNIFDIGDNLSVEYYKYKSNYYVSKVETDLQTNQKERLATRINVDPTMLRYKEKLTVYIGDEKNIFTSMLVMPEKIQTTEFNLLDDSEYYNLLYKNITSIEENKEIRVTFIEQLEILKIINIADEEHEITYKFTDNYEKNSLVFNSLGSGIYQIKIQFKNGDIIKYLFK